MARQVRSAVFALLAALVTLLTLPAHALEPDEILSDPKLEKRARALSTELRCAVCQNQSIDDSNAPLARDLRLLVRERLKAGDSDSDVLKFIVARYGEFVLLRPPVAINTLLLWLGPPAMLLVTLIFLFTKVRRERLARERKVEPLSTAEAERLKSLLSDPSKS
jgi:cytochrome c-type biogenesis protein CcmH